MWLLFSEFINEQFKLNLSSFALQLTAILAPLIVLEINFVNLLTTVGKTKAANLILMFVEAFIALFSLMFFYFDLSDVDYLCYLLVASHLIVVFLSSLYIKSLGFLIRPQYAAIIFKENYKFGIKSQLGNAFQVLNYRLDHLILGAFLGPKLLGIYVVATKAAEFFRFFSLSIVFVVEPIIASAVYSDAVKLVKKYYLPISFINFGFHPQQKK